METPVVLIVFKRPDTTGQVLDVIRRIRPTKFFVIADGPRSGYADEAEKCASARAIVEDIDWPCEVHRNYSATNLGCGRRVASGISWVFEHVEEAIILEDDCLPHPSFFRFCQALLERYRYDTRIMHIGGNNFQNGIKRGPYSYFFSRYNHIWGWATWRRAWRHFDHQLSTWPQLKGSEEQRNLFDTDEECSYWSRIFDRMAGERPLDTWDYSWTYACFTQGLSIHPNVNLVSNIGFGGDATHTLTGNHLAAIPALDIGEMSHPPWIFRNREADMYTFDHVYGGGATQLKHCLWCLLSRSLRRLSARRSNRHDLLLSRIR